MSFDNTPPGLTPPASRLSSPPPISRGLFIGIQTPGTTSRMRSNALRLAAPECHWAAIDTDQWFRAGSRLARSLAFRIKSGPVVTQINRGVQAALADDRWDLVWIDKGVYLWPETIRRVRRQAERMIHYTPDTAFRDNRSRHFFATASLYDLLVTTKSFELEDYHRLVPAEKVHLTTQGYDASLHFPRHLSEQKKREVVFIGLCEPHRERCIAALIDVGVSVVVGGVGWDRFVEKHCESPHLRWLGSKVFGDAYANALSEASIGLGLLSKRFPELHTTRTLEIPACGTVLATESTVETRRMFDQGSVLFFRDEADLAARVKRMLESPNELAKIARSGMEAVRAMGATHEAIVGRALHVACAG